jgi:hypothetical protein
MHNMYLGLLVFFLDALVLILLLSPPLSLYISLFATLADSDMFSKMAAREKASSKLWVQCSRGEMVAKKALVKLMKSGADLEYAGDGSKCA